VTQALAQELLPIIQAFAAGKVVESCSLVSYCASGCKTWSSWGLDLNPDFGNQGKLFRLKADKPEPRKWWIVESGSALQVFGPFADLESAKSWTKTHDDSWARIIPVQEIL